MCLALFGHAATSCMRRKAIISGHARLPNQTRVCRCVCGGFARPRRRVDTGLDEVKPDVVRDDDEQRRDGARLTTLAYDLYPAIVAARWVGQAVCMPPAGAGHRDVVGLRVVPSPRPHPMP